VARIHKFATNLAANEVGPFAVTPSVYSECGSGK